MHRLTAVTTSWDDGHPLDMQLAAKLARHGISGTFYVSLQNPGMSPPDPARLRELVAMGMEVGSHTVTHADLTELPRAAVSDELRQSRETLEDWLGMPVTAFCYPRGKFDRNLFPLLEEAGYRLARTTEAFRTSTQFHPFRMPVSLQLYPHSRGVHVRHALKEGNYDGLWNWCRRYSSPSSPASLSGALFRHVVANGGVFHVWGHSWEIAEQDLWQSLDEMLEQISGHPGVAYMTNSQTAAACRDEAPPVAGEPPKKNFRRGVAAALLVVASLALPLRAQDPACMIVPSQPVVEPRAADESDVQSTLHVAVNHPRASDKSQGAQNNPLRTISRAVEIATANNIRNIGTRIVVHPGQYRESVQLPIIAGGTSAAIIVEAAVNGTVTVSGADQWTDWRWEGDGVFSAHWPNRWGLAPYPEGWLPFVRLSQIVRRSEMVIVGGQPLRQVLAYRDLDDDTFYADEQGSRLYVRLASGADPEYADTEVAGRRQLLFAQGKTNLVLRGLTFRYAASPVAGAAVVIADSSKVLVEDCQFEWNNWQGLAIQVSSEVSVRRNTANHNGALGMGGFQLKNAAFDDNETSFNNWRGARGGFYDWAVAGSKFFAAHDVIFRNHRALDNEAIGFWLDYDNQRVTVESGVFCRNQFDGMFLEASPGPITVRNTILCRNTQGSGVLGSAVSGVHLHQNQIYDNALPQIRIAGELERDLEDWESGRSSTVRSERWTIGCNAVTTFRQNQKLLELPVWPHFSNSLILIDNLWSVMPANFLPPIAP